jgi:hypothetical protein
VVELLRMQVTLLVENGKKYADVGCVLGTKRLEADYETTDQYCGQVKGLETQSDE